MILNNFDSAEDSSSMQMNEDKLAQINEKVTSYTRSVKDTMASMTFKIIGDKVNAGHNMQPFVDAGSLPAVVMACLLGTLQGTTGYIDSALANGDIDKKLQLKIHSITWRAYQEIENLLKAL
jgi:hypothetical protein